MLVALTHGYPPTWALGGEVSLHRTLLAVPGPVAVLTGTEKPYTFEGIPVHPLELPNLLDTEADPAGVAEHLKALGATAVIAQNELSLPGVRAARLLGIPSIVSVHTPPRFGAGVRAALPLADHVIYNTATSAAEWREPKALVIHPPIGELPAPPKRLPQGDAYTLLSSLGHKGVGVVLELADALPDQRFIIVRSPATAMEPADLELQVSRRPNVELHDRVEPSAVPETFLSQTRILLVPSRYETYGMSAIEAAGYGIPSVHVDTPHAREGIGTAAELVRPLNARDALAAVKRIEDGYAARSVRSYRRAEFLMERQKAELAAWAAFAATVKPLPEALRAERERSLNQPRGRGYRATPRHDALEKRRLELEAARRSRQEAYRAAREQERAQLRAQQQGRDA